jgi:alkylation response protein AidB-like acyl-CoA dehydrogenase
MAIMDIDLHTVRDNVIEIGPLLDQYADEADRMGRLPDEIAQALRSSGVMRLLQSRDYGGYEASPLDWFNALHEVGRYSGSAAWVTGVVGVHPFEVALADRRLQEEIYGEDPNVWVASPYAPFGRARKVEGGYIFNGRWPWSTGTTHCEWTVLGGLIVDEEGTPGPFETHVRHFFLPKSDYRHAPEEWRIAGLSGSGSYDVIVEDAFIPDYRVIDPRDIMSGAAARAAGRGDSALYRMPFTIMFSGTIAAGTLSIAQGALDAFVAYSRDRQTRLNHDVSRDPHQLSALAIASAELDAGRVHFLHDIGRIWDLAQKGEEIPMDLIVEVRRNQVRAVQRAVSVIDELMRHAGGAAMSLDNPFQRFWRDLHTGANHGSNVAEPKYEAFGLMAFGHPLPPGLRL